MTDTMNRRAFLKTVGAGLAAAALPIPIPRTLAAEPKASRPNIVLIMSDDQGYGDTAYTGHPHLKTPVLDEMAAKGLRFDRFYAGHPVCSPTRGSVMTGRNPNRFGCFLYNYSIRPQEITIAEVLKRAGYATGHFGKWHLGPVKADSPVNPGASGFDEWLSHDNFFELNPPLSRNGGEPREYPGESSQVVVDASLEFIEKSLAAKKPFLTVVWFGSPHTPHKALDEDKKPYSALSSGLQNYLGEITAMDRAIGHLRKQLAKLGVADDTLVWFCSDNGATGPGSTGGLKGKKGGLWEGGIRVPGIIEWPARVPKPFATALPCCTVDIYPTIVDILGLTVPDQIQPIDGISLLPLIQRKMTERPKPLAFWTYPSKGESKNGSFLNPEGLKGTWRTFRNLKHPVPRTKDFPGHAVLMGNRYKLHKLGEKYELYDVVADPAETKNLAPAKPDVVAQMKPALAAWQTSVERSLAGMDYGKEKAAL